jgi:hypothetical protein
MIEEEITKGGLDFGALRYAVEAKDPDALIGFYAEEAELRIENAALPDGVAFELRGRAEIERYLRAVCDQEVRCLIEGEVVVGEGRMAFREVCQYAGGSRISVKTTLEIAEGAIFRQTDVVQRAHRDERSQR